MNFFENWYTSSHCHNNNTGKVSWTSEVWIKRYEKVLDRHTDYTNRLFHSHRRKLFLEDKNKEIVFVIRNKSILIYLTALYKLGLTNRKMNNLMKGWKWISNLCYEKHPNTPQKQQKQSAVGQRWDFDRICVSCYNLLGHRVFSSNESASTTRFSFYKNMDFLSQSRRSYL